MSVNPALVDPEIVTLATELNYQDEYRKYLENRGLLIGNERVFRYYLMKLLMDKKKELAQAICSHKWRDGEDALWADRIDGSYLRCEICYGSVRRRITKSKIKQL